MSAIRQIWGLAAICALVSGVAIAEESLQLRAPVTGLEVGLSLAEIEAIGVRELVTGTPWTEGEARFSAISGAQLVEQYKLDGETVVAIALNDYIVDIEFDRFNRDDIFIATRMDGEPMPVSKFGPFWIMFDFDELSPAEEALARSLAVWQLVELEFE